MPGGLEAGLERAAREHALATLGGGRVLRVLDAWRAAPRAVRAAALALRYDKRPGALGDAASGAVEVEG